jgi:hypothetical protein
MRNSTVLIAAPDQGRIVVRLLVRPQKINLRLRAPRFWSFASQSRLEFARGCEIASSEAKLWLEGSNEISLRHFPKRCVTVRAIIVQQRFRGASFCRGAWTSPSSACGEGGGPPRGIHQLLGARSDGTTLFGARGPIERGYPVWHPKQSRLATAADLRLAEHATPLHSHPRRGREMVTA